MTTEEIQATKRTKAQIQQKEAGLAEAIRLKALQEEEAARQLKTKFEKLVKSIENFVPMETDERVKRQGVQLEQEFLKKQKTIEEDSVLEESITEPVIAKEEEIEKYVKKRGKIRKQKARKGIHIDNTAQDESEKEREAFIKDKVTSASSESEIGIDAILTATKPPTILKDFSRDDLTKLYRLVIKKYGINRPEEIYNRVLWGDLKTMFDPPLSDDAIWSLPLQQKMINLDDRKYPLSKDACQVMLKMKLLDGTTDEVWFGYLEAVMELRRKVSVFSFSNKQQWSSVSTMSNRHQELASPKQSSLHWHSKSKRLLEFEDLNHLLFQCSFATELWNRIRKLADIEEDSLNLGNITQYLCNSGITVKDSDAVREIEVKWDISCQRATLKNSMGSVAASSNAHGSANLKVLYLKVIRSILMMFQLAISDGLVPWSLSLSTIQVYMQNNWPWDELCLFLHFD
ncbi:hypothetical protein Tco_0083712 [Tanacetum coccineum]